MSRFTLKNNHAKSEAGFTIIELLIATAVFATVLVLCATAVVQVGQLFYKGVVSNRVQDTSRKVANDVIGAIQYGNSNLTHQKIAIAGGYAECVGSIRYTYLLATKSVGSGAGQSPHVLWKDRIGASGACSASPVNMNSPAGAGEELLGSNMRITDFDITPLSGSSWQVKITVAYGATDDVFAVVSGVPDYTHCAQRKLGGQFCAISSITSYATERL
jgi:prepilin-type N-terminal cleavage/methylation domain-containing protein